MRTLLALILLSLPYVLIAEVSREVSWARAELKFPEETWAKLNKGANLAEVGSLLDTLEAQAARLAPPLTGTRFYFRLADALGPRDKWSDPLREVMQLRSMPESQLQQLLTTFPDGPDKEVNELADQLRTELSRRKKSVALTK